jgi:hypothetical protein
MRAATTFAFLAALAPAALSAQEVVMNRGEYFVGGHFRWWSGPDAIALGSVRLSHSDKVTYSIHIEIPTSVPVGPTEYRPTLLPKTERIRVWVLTEDGGALQVISKPREGSAPTRVERPLSKREFAVFGPFQFRVGRTPMAVAFSIDGFCYLLPVWGGPSRIELPSIYTDAVPNHCPN